MPGGPRLHAASCQVKVFKLKGADRKHKQDRDKILRRPPHEQDKYQPSYDCTVLSDVSLRRMRAFEYKMQKSISVIGKYSSGYNNLFFLSFFCLFLSQIPLESLSPASLATQNGGGSPYASTDAM